jgi:hypothetical protein
MDSDPEADHYARLLSWAVTQIPESFAKSRKRALCMMANIRNLADLIDEHAQKTEIVLLAATDANFTRLFDALVETLIMDLEDDQLQLIAFGAVSAALVLFIDSSKAMTRMVNACSVELIAAGLFAHISWNAMRTVRLKDQPLRYSIHEPLWVLNRCLMHWDDAQIDRLMYLARCDKIIEVTLGAILEPVTAQHLNSSVSQMSKLREESLDLLLAFCFSVFARSETHNCDFSESMVEHLLKDVSLFQRLARFVCEQAIVHSRSTAVGLSLILWCCLLFGCVATEKACGQLKSKLALFMMRFEKEPIFTHLWDTLSGVDNHEDILIDFLATPHYLLKAVARNRLCH